MTVGLGFNSSRGKIRDLSGATSHFSNFCWRPRWITGLAGNIPEPAIILNILLVVVVSVEFKQ